MLFAHHVCMYVSVHSLLKETRKIISDLLLSIVLVSSKNCVLAGLFRKVIAQKPHHSHISSPSAEITYNLILHTGVLN